jgi:ribosomal protein S18 acetylase RimI-like enzyme
METRPLVPTSASKDALINLIGLCREGLPTSLTKDAIPAYVDKILDRAVIVEALEGDRRLGLIAFYANDATKKQAFITLVLVHPDARGKGVARTLLKVAEERIRSKRFDSIKLRVLGGNKKAIGLYIKAGYEVSEALGDELEMILELG